MKQIFRLFNLTVLLLGISIATTATALQPPPVQVPIVHDMREISRLARDTNLPILLVFSADDCPYCDILESEIIKPMILSGDYTQRVLIYKMNINDVVDIHDFDGEKISTDSFAANRNSYLTPTMLFLDANGNELHPRILGINTIEMFGGRVDSAIALSLEKLRSRTIASNTN